LGPPALRDLSVRRTEKIPKVPFSENGSLKREHNPKKSEWVGTAASQQNAAESQQTGASR
jgi:hypothetical protein